MLVLVRSPLLTSHKWRELVSSGRLGYRCHGVFVWYNVCFVLLRFRIYAFVEAATLLFNRPSICWRPDSHTCFFFLFLFSLLFIWRCRFFRVFFCTIPALCLESTSYSFLSNGLFLPSDHGAGFWTSAYVRIQSINQSIVEFLPISVAASIYSYP